MEFFAILVILAILSRLIEAARGGTRPPPGPRQPGPRRPGSLPRERTEQGGDSPARSESPAADMIPDDLWELLTGQKRQPPAPPPAPAPPAKVATPQRTGRLSQPRRPPVLDEEVEQPRTLRDEDAEAEQFLRSHRRDVSGEIDAVLAEQRAVVAGRAPAKVVRTASLEVEPPPEPERHRQFHEKIDRPVAAAAQPIPIARSLGLTNTRDLRRALVLREVLGPPKALEEPGPVD